MHLKRRSPSITRFRSTTIKFLKKFGNLRDVDYDVFYEFTKNRISHVTTRMRSAAFKPNH